MITQNAPIYNAPRGLEAPFPVEITRVHFSRTDYDASSLQYEKLTDSKLRNTDTIVLGGYGVQVKVQHNALVLCYGRANQEEKEIKLYRGVNKVKQIIVCSDGGYFSIEGIKWCKEQGITIYLLDWRGSLIQTLAPRQPSNARLVCKQYLASQSDLGLAISVELIRLKAQSQIDTLSKYPHLPKQAYAIDVLKDELSQLHTVSTVEKLRAMEGKIAYFYFSVFIDMPIKWTKAVAKTLPPHWLTITERTSPLSKDHGARWSINPFNSCLNFAYALLEAQVLQAIIVAGLEPSCAYLHCATRERDMKNLLVYDLMEPFRAIVDAKILVFFEKTTFSKGDFFQVYSGEVRLNEELRRYVLATCRVPQDSIDSLVSWLKQVLEKS